MSPGLALLLGWLAFGVVDALASTVLQAQPEASVAATVRLWAMGYAVAAGVSGATLTLLWHETHGRLRGLGWLFVASVAIGVGALTLQDDVAGPAARFAGAGADAPWVAALVAFNALSVVAVGLAATLLARPSWRIVPLVVGVGLAPANVLVLEGDYWGAHLMMGVSAASALGCGMTGLKLPTWLAWLERHRGWVVASLAAPALVATSVAPSHAARVYLGRTWSADLQPYLPSVLFAARPPRAGTKPTERVRKSVPRAVLDGGTPLLPKDPIVIYYSVDSLRSDLLAEEHAADLPNMHRLKGESLWFAHARAPGSATVFTLSSVMAGTYFSQQYWTRRFVPEGKGVRKLLPHEDLTPRFPEILAAGGIPTVHYAQAIWLLNEYGMTHGFTEEKFIAPTGDTKWSRGERVMDAIVARLRKHGSGPLFLFFHDLDPHAPFNLTNVEGSRYERYLAEVKLVDARLGRLRAVLEETGLSARAALIFTADHGEAFRDHGTNFHGQNLYEEQIRVPLLFHLPSVTPRRVDANVTLMDLAPTILELMSRPLSPHLMGQSLAPFLRGGARSFDRPLVFEAKRKQALLLKGRFKVIRDTASGAIEIYDLKKDRKEKRNLYDRLGHRGQAMLAKLQSFYDTHEIRREGYRIPYRK